MTGTLTRDTRTAPPATEEYGRRSYDLVKEFVVALVVVTLLTVGLSIVFSSPDEPPSTLASWATDDPNDFVATAVTELDRTSATATYGAPYTDTPDAGQKLGPLQLQRWAGIRQRVDTAEDFVLGPLRVSAAHDTQLSGMLDTYNAASAEGRDKWATDYSDALSKVDNDPAKVSGDFGPVPQMMAKLLTLAQSGALDGELVASGSQFYQTDYTRPLLFIADGSYLEDRARGQHLAGDQWGMMNETGDYPGQAWLWLYSFWYQIEPFKSSDNADALVWGLMALLTLLLALVPFIPGLRSVPRWTRVYRLIWRDYYRNRR